MKKLIISGLFLAANIFAMTDFELAQKNDAVMSGFEDSSSIMTMTLLNAKGQTRIRQMKSISLEKDGGDKSLIEFLSPADVKGTKFLNYEHAKKMMISGCIYLHLKE